MVKVAVLGSANMDLVVRQPRWVQPGETIFGSSFVTGPGGKGLNQAVACARAGGDVSFIGAIGRDDFGSRLTEALTDEGISTDRLQTVDGATGIAAITVTDDGENAIVVVSGANGHDELTDQDRAEIASASHLVVQLERPEPLLVEAMTFARAEGVTTVLTPAPAREGIDDLLALTDVLVPNQGEAELLSGEAGAEDAGVALSEAGRTVIVTRGEEGAVVCRDGAVVAHVPPREVPAVDTTGAGDTFVGALVAWLAGGASLEDALAAASVAASIAVTREGAAAAAPTRDEILRALAQD